MAKRRARRSGTVLALAVAVGVSLAACGGTEGDAATEEPTGTSAPAEPSEEPTAEESPTLEPVDANPTFGDADEWDNGLIVAIGEPEEFQPSDTAAGITDDTIDDFREFAITVVNNTSENYDARFFSATVQSGNKEADRIFDIERGLELPPSTAILPGREGTWQIGFGVSDPEDLVMEVLPGVEYEAAIFTSG